MTFCMGVTPAWNNSWNAMDSNCGRTDVWRNTGDLQIMSLCCQKTGGSDVCWLGTHDKGSMTWDSPLQHFARWQHFEDWIVTSHATDLWQHYFNDFCSLILR